VSCLGAVVCVRACVGCLCGFGLCCLCCTRLFVLMVRGCDRVVVLDWSPCVFSVCFFYSLWFMLGFVLDEQEISGLGRRICGFVAGLG